MEKVFETRKFNFGHEAELNEFDLWLKNRITLGGRTSSDQIHFPEIVNCVSDPESGMVIVTILYTRYK